MGEVQVLAGHFLQFPALKVMSMPVRRKAAAERGGRERARIATAKLIKQLEDHALGKLELRPTQVSAALGLLKKALPDLGKAPREGKKTRKLVVAWRDGK